MSGPDSQILDSLASLWKVALQPAGCPICGQVHLIQTGQEGSLCPALWTRKTIHSNSLVNPGRARTGSAIQYKPAPENPGYL